MPALPFEQVLDQLNAIRKHLGPGGNVQITSGEVTLLPVEDLIRILLAARALDLSPMVMTHGERFLAEPDYLDRLVTEGRLTKVSIHIDATQRGRSGLPVPANERQLDDVRERFNRLFEAGERRTGTRLKAASTMTVTADNLHEIEATVDWFLQKGTRFRILSLQPQAAVGRTSKATYSVTADQVWRQVEAGVGQSLNPYPFEFGHRACTRLTLLLLVDTGQRHFRIEAVRRNSVQDAKLMQQFLDDFRGVVINDRSKFQRLKALLPVLIRRPQWFVRLTLYGMRRMWQDRRLIAAIVGSLRNPFRIRIRPFCIVVHAFMSAAEMATDKGRERLQACAFKVPYRGQMVSMCAFNGLGQRSESYQRR